MRLITCEYGRGVKDVLITYEVLHTRFFSLEYLKRIAGPRTVPVELGSRYTDSNWTQKLMTLSEFIDNHVILSVSQSCLVLHIQYYCFVH